MSETPQTWETISFGELNEFVSSNIDPATNPDELFTLYSVPSYPQQIPERILGRSIGSTKQLVRHDDVLVCKINPRINRVWRVFDNWDATQIASSEWIVLRSNKCIARYLQYYFKSPGFREMICTDVTGVGGSLTRAQPKRVSTFPVPIPPAAEQKRIADKLDSLLSRVDGCRERLDRVPAILRRFRQSVLAAATTGKLTEDWRRNRGISPEDDNFVHALVAEPYKHVCCGPASWELTTLGDVCEFIGGSQPPKSTFVHKDGPGLVRLIQIRDYKSDSHITFIPKSLAKRFCSPTDVMIGRYGPPIFQILRGLEGAYNVALMKARPRTTQLDLEYLYVFLRGELLLKYVEAGSDRTAGQSGVRKELLDPYPFFLPSLDEQVEIAKRVATLLSFGETAQSKLDFARQKIETFDSAILAKAFRGEIVLQDPSDEPASVLLERIRDHKQSLDSEKKSIKNPKTEVGRKRMKKITPESLSEVILELPEESFSFDQLRQKVNGNYEDIKIAVFTLLEKNEIGLTQYFDEKAKEMRFTRAAK